MPKNTRRRITITIASAAGLGFVSCALWKLHVTYRPLPPVPTPVMPKPNAYDIYTEAINLSDDNDAVDPAFTHPTPLEVDGAVKANLPAVTKVREGFRYSYMSPPIRTFRTILPNTGRYRSLCRVLAFEGRASAAHGQWDDAMSYDIDAIRLASDLPRGADLWGAFTGYACESIGRRHTWDYVDHLSDRAAKIDALRLNQIASAEVPLTDVLQQQSWATQASLEDVFKKPNWRDGFDADALSGGSSGRSASAWTEDLSKIRLLLVDPNSVVLNYHNYISGWIRLGKLPYPALMRARRPVEPGDPVNQMEDNEINEAYPVLNRESTLALDELLAAELALRAYKLDHGAYPVTLNALAPAYLPSIPIDPFTDAHPLCYRRAADGYLLYSVGPDATDDHGTPIASSDWNFGAPFLIDPRSLLMKGDIVAGVNY